MMTKQGRALSIRAVFIFDVVVAIWCAYRNLYWLRVGDAYVDQSANIRAIAGAYEALWLAVALLAIIAWTGRTRGLVGLALCVTALVLLLSKDLMRDIVSIVTSPTPTDHLQNEGARLQLFFSLAATLVLIGWAVLHWLILRTSNTQRFTSTS